MTLWTMVVSDKDVLCLPIIKMIGALALCVIRQSSVLVMLGVTLLQKFTIFLSIVILVFVVLCVSRVCSAGVLAKKLLKPFE